jgi:hypothetical protein
VAGTKLEIKVMKKSGTSLMKKRNKRTDIMAHMELAPLTEQILAQMGQEGANIRKRLTVFYRQRACPDHGRAEKYPDIPS